MAFVKVEHLTKRYERSSGWTKQIRTVVDDVSFEINAGETLGVVGESGSGKSTVARMILGLVEPSNGRVLVDGIDPALASAAALQQLRRQMQPVFQDPFAALNPRMKVQQIILEPWQIHRGSNPSLDASSAQGKSKDVARSEAARLLRQVGLDESALHRYPHEFSGGQRQRINIARALALRPNLLILDEPVSALDVSVGAQVINLLRSLQRELGMTYLFISHSMPLIRYLSTRIAVMEKGRLVEIGEADELCANPRQPYTQRLLAATPELPATA